MFLSFQLKEAAGPVSVKRLPDPLVFVFLSADEFFGPLFIFEDE